jgi:hypothetical protein
MDLRATSCLNSTVLLIPLSAYNLRIAGPGRFARLSRYQDAFDAVYRERLY